MGAPFPRWSNTAVRLALAGGLVTVVAVPSALMALMRTPYVTGRDDAVVQPIPFDHRHHVRDDGLDCRYCHATAERADTAGMPSTETCLGCHAQIWTASPLLAPVRASWFEGRPIAWRRVHDLPDFVSFSHRAHLAKGVGCVSCHGRVDLMPAVAPAASLQMRWCLDCHHDPAPALRPREHLTDGEWTPPDDGGALQASLARANGVKPVVHCSACHR